MKKQILINKKGITLIALVVTIVVLLILAGVSIAMLTGDNGIIKQAQDAKEKNKEAEIEENVKLAVMASKTEGKGNIDYDELNSELDKIGYKGEDITELPAKVTIDGVTVQINKDGSTEIVKGESDDTENDGETGDNEDTENDGETGDNDDTEDDGKTDGDDTGDVGNDTIVPGTKYDTETEIVVGDVPVTVIGGTTISGIPGEYESVDNGFVIYIIPEGETVTDWEADSDSNGIIDVQEKYDQFVWVPVPNAIAEDMNNSGTVDETDIDLMIAEEKYPIAIATDVTNYRGVLYNFTLTSSGNVSIKARSATELYKEPVYLNKAGYADTTSYNNVGITESSLQVEFNTMVNRVSSNKGFWVGRYETSNMVGTATTSRTNSLNKEKVGADSINKITVIKGITTGISYDSTIPNYINWYRMYAQQKNYSSLATISSTSSMIWGSQWDQIMIWMKEVDNTDQSSKYVVNSIGMGNFGGMTGVNDGYSDTSNPATTGCFNVKNIYDLAGNVIEFTLEGYSNDHRLLRRGLL